MALRERQVPFIPHNGLGQDRIGAGNSVKRRTFFWAISTRHDEVPVVAITPAGCYLNTVKKSTCTENMVRFPTMPAFCARR